ncbi:MAG: STAS/SEC14 domain-containing protein [Rhodospirillales bacterium]
MITYQADEKQRILTIVVNGMITESDLDAAMSALQNEYPAVGVHLLGGERGGFRMLVDWEHLEGWEKGAKTAGTVFARCITDAVSKIAVIAAAKWSGEQERLADVAKNATVRFFLPSDRDDALSWLHA